MHIEAVNMSHPLRKMVELLVHKVYARQYGAFVTSFPDVMFAAFDDDHLPVCAAGIRTEETGFFSQCYLGEQVDIILSRISDEKVTSASIVEVTTLAAIKPWMSLKLLDYIITYSRNRGKEWGLFTGTSMLKKRLDYTGQAMHDLGAAMDTAVPNPANWGRYYQTSPRVFAFNYQGLMSQTQIEPPEVTIHTDMPSMVQNVSHPIYMKNAVGGAFYA